MKLKSKETAPSKDQRDGGDADQSESDHRPTSTDVFLSFLLSTRPSPRRVLAVTGARRLGSLGCLGHGRSLFRTGI